ncbi:hypothetical protein [Cytophaga hutchinsonii]|uniref:Uncharacterized protein n=1 Tax=Cytophaga hutchinsonii (strain ATCC 33406 / DSM 1761 / CIP 103989 / NBRC 15051 / NCIMB 9469 / D465) TaxID=269798 RepID=A0A6N4STN1_CYTH3|nr:hypothetical protein [Cytophaga hutchinsonii]ABG59731.1 hypothetical protein CHU_2477 [Cytophaga hutchinsonii ATCC 33406]SFX65242.1 hypothetical protein SAMN04487930_10756 [Cytophaga hutchinsonii ATCC 33406]
MKTLFKSILLTSILFLSILNNLQAQNKYDYAMVTYRFKDKIVEVDINGEVYTKIDVDVKENGNSYYLVSPALKQVKKMNNEGWELFDTAITEPNGGYSIYLLFKKKSRLTI